MNATTTTAEIIDFTRTIHNGTEDHKELALRNIDAIIAVEEDIRSRMEYVGLDGRAPTADECAILERNRIRYAIIKQLEASLVEAHAALSAGE